ncbi:hypothetical protein F5148DRAFT_1290295 [Russula earlei]|uniref:Uncharacterized protein n=1 Tax=Russula earlei TaxID=71964 RepID=A0ACC0TVW2_9AGAM|nr:hypothetical protein F5148DRAFT_1290295 [Russula earlei]
MDIPAKRYAGFMEACREKDIVFYTVQKAVPNIVSSYPAIDIFVHDGWLKGGVYKDVFDTFHYTPRLKMNICDGNQSLAPFFEGHLNWVSSSRTHFWYLYIRFPGTPVVYCWPVWVYTNDMAVLSQQIEDAILQRGECYQSDTTALFTEISNTIVYTSAPIEQELSLPGFAVPYYEGFNRSGDCYWLGIYRRDELYPLSFMLDVCAVCLETRIGELYTTPWKSIIIKGIDHAQRHLWDYILGKHRINVRHAANELNWQVEDHTEEGLALKRYLIRQFDKEDVRTYGLCFAIQTRARSSMFGSVLIRRQQNKNPHRLRTLDRYDILYTKDFNPNSTEYLLFRENMEKSFIGTYLVSLSGACQYPYSR